ncbi:MAG TPA: P-loop NTPase fold protein [Flavobacterium sp.]|jgi:hypothetical protein
MLLISSISKKILLCIDDIDRKSPNLNIKEFFGFINNLVENHDAKVLLIANESELRKEADLEEGSYSVLREKVIGVSVTYSANVSLIFEKIILQRYKENNPQYYNYLIANKVLITELINKNNKNLRNLLFFLEHFKIIFNGALTIINSDGKYEAIKENLLDELLKFTLPVAIEYKMGRLHSENSEEIESVFGGYFFDLQAFLGEKKDTIEKSYSDYFKETYFGDSQAKRFFFKSIYHYILGQTSFVTSELADNIDSIYKIGQAGVSEKQHILSKLSYWDCLNLSHQEYQDLTEKLLTYVDGGEFELEEYPSIYRHVVRFENALSYHLDDLVIRFKSGIDIGISHYKHECHFSMHFRINDTDEYFSHIKLIVDYCLEVNDRIKTLQFEQEISELFQLAKTDFGAFLETIQESNTEIYYTPVFSKFDFSEFIQVFENLKNKQIIDLGFHLQHKYREGMNPDLYPDENFIKELVSFVEAKLQNGALSKFKTVAYQFLVTKGKIALTNFQ